MTMKNIPTQYTKALIYCRISSTRQKNEGHGLESQEQRCREYATQKGYEVERVFPDDFSGGGDFMRRPAMSALLAYLDSKPHIDYVVIFDDLKRFARDTVFHIKLRQEFKARKAKPECLNFNFDDTPEGEFLETILAAQGQLERQQNKRQVIQKMKARLQEGYWVFCPPLGLKNIKDSKGKIIVSLSSVEPYATIYKAAIEKYANFDLGTLESVRQFVLAKYSENNIRQKLSLHGAHSILTELLYTGYLEYSPWGIERMKGKHEGFITLEMFNIVQERLAGKAKPALRKDYDQDFPIRNFVSCPACHNRLTAAWFKGRHSRYAYYICKTRSCVRKNKGIPKADIEGNFVKLLKQLCPTDNVLKLSEAILNDLWATRQLKETEVKKGIGAEILTLEEEIRQLVSRIPKTSNTLLITEYEKSVTENAEKISKLKDEMNKIKYPPEMFQTAVRIVFDYLKNPVNQWDNPDYQKKRLLLNMYFENRITYDMETGYQTADLPVIIRVLSQQYTSKQHLVEMPGVKPGSKTSPSSHYSQD
jgi:site-specific DNA recombinase